MDKTAFNQEKFRVRNLQDDQEKNGQIGIIERITSFATGLSLLKSSFKMPGVHPIKFITGSYLIFRSISGKCPLKNALAQGKHHAVNARVILTINKPREEVYQFWRNLQNLPKFMTHIKKVEEVSETESHWTIELPWHTGEVSWNSHIVKDEPNEMIGWHSEKMAILENSGKAEFFDAPNGRGTIVNLVVSYHPPVGELGLKVAHLLHPAFENKLRQELRNFKQLIETGEIAAPFNHSHLPGNRLCAI